MRRIAAYVGLALAMAGGLYGLQEQTANRLKANQIKACVRGNVLRHTLNLNVAVTADFLHTAHAVRQQAAVLARKQGNKKEAAINQVAADRYARQEAALAPVDPVDCRAVIK